MSCNTYAEANNKYMNNYNKNIECNSMECNSVESSYLKYLHGNNLYEWAMYQKLPANGFKLVKNGI